MLRYALGVTVTMAIAQGVAFRLSYLAPMLVCSLLSGPTPLSFRNGFAFVAVIAVSVAFGWLTAAALLPYPLVCAIAIVLLLFGVFYLGTGTTPAFMVTMLLIAITLMPVVGQEDIGLISEIGVGLALAGATAVFSAWIAFLLLPPPPVAAQSDASTAPTRRTDAERLRAALRATVMIAPLQLAFLTFGWSAVLVLMFAAILAQQPDAQAGARSARGLVLANLLGGAVAIAAYNFLVLAPWYPFLIALTFLLALVFAERVFGATPRAAFYASAFSAALILIGSSVTPYADDASAKFYERFFQILLAGVYVAAALTLLPVPRIRTATAGATG